MVRFGGLLVLFFVLAAGAPQAFSQERSFGVRSIAEVAEGALPEVAEITHQDAVLRFRSNIPLACSVVYGETAAFGQIAVDQDMNGGAHENHHPLMANLLPDREYHFRVQGVATDGRVFVGETQTFRTAAAPRDARANLASLREGARVAAVSSNWSNQPNDGSFGANSAIDGQRGSAWSSNGDGDGAFIVVELPKRARIGEVEVWTRSMSDGTAQTYKFTLTTDDGLELGPFELPDASKPYRFAVDVEAKTLRLDVVESSGGNTGLVEFAVYEK
ncbi:MAG: discoidin domain-containing protein [Alphaproteobacteria bacterium]|nr:discoidin domain-containing protein [Alphaproteobacteria bacterium]